MGRSLVTGREVFPDIREALANTFVLGVAAWVLSVSLGVGIGVISSIRRNSVFDYVTTGGAFLGLSMPPFWFGLVLQLVFGLYLTSWLGLGSPIFPTAGMFAPGSTGFDVADRLRHLVLPVLALSVQFVAVYSRYMRASMLDVMHSEYVRTARAKGLRERWVVGRHAVRNALIPLTTQAAIDLGSLAGGLIVTEVIFSWPGMGLAGPETTDVGWFAQEGLPELSPGHAVRVADSFEFHAGSRAAYFDCEKRDTRSYSSEPNLQGR